MNHKKLVYVLSPNKRVKIKIQKRLYQEQQGFHWTAEPQLKGKDGWYTYNHHILTGWSGIEAPELTLEDEEILARIMEYVMLFITRISPEYTVSSFLDVARLLEKYQREEQQKEELDEPVVLSEEGTDEPAAEITQ